MKSHRGVIADVDLRVAIRKDAFLHGASALPVLSRRLHDWDRCGRLRSDATYGSFHRGRKPKNSGLSFPPTPPTPDEVLAILEECNPSAPHGIRDRALIALLWRSGLRISEALSLVRDDLRPESDEVVVRRGKGAKYGVSGMDSFGWQELVPWLAIRDRYPAGPVFCCTEGVTRGCRLGSAQFRLKLAQLAVQAGITHRVVPHGLRHAHACDLAREGVPVHLISRQLRHSNIGTTATYLASIAPREVVDAIVARPSPGREVAA